GPFIGAGSHRVGYNINETQTFNGSVTLTATYTNTANPKSVWAVILGPGTPPTTPAPHMDNSIKCSSDRPSDVRGALEAHRGTVSRSRLEPLVMGLALPYREDRSLLASNGCGIEIEWYDLGSCQHMVRDRVLELQIDHREDDAFRVDQRHGRLH